MPFLRCLILLLCVLCLPCPAEAQNAAAPQKPSFGDCQKLASAKTDAVTRAAITERFKAGRFFCSMASNPFTVGNVFTGGQSNAQLRLVLGADGLYGVESRNLYDILLPDHRALSLLHFMMMAGQALMLVGDLFSSSLDAEGLNRAGRHVSNLAAGAGANARILLKEVETLRIAAQLDEKDVRIPFWLPRLASIRGDTTVQSTAVPSAWMQKAGGMLQHILGTFQGGGE